MEVEGICCLQGYTMPASQRGIPPKRSMMPHTASAAKKNAASGVHGTTEVVPFHDSFNFTHNRMHEMRDRLGCLRRMLVLWRGNGDLYEFTGEWKTEALRGARDGWMGARDEFDSRRGPGFQCGPGAAGDGGRAVDGADERCHGEAVAREDSRGVVCSGALTGSRCEKLRKFYPGAGSGGGAGDVCDGVRAAGSGDGVPAGEGARQNFGNRGRERSRRRQDEMILVVHGRGVCARGSDGADVR